MPSSRPPAGRLGAVLVGVWLLVGVGALAAGLDYYRLPRLERAYSPADDLFSPTGLIGHSLGYIGTLLVVVGVGSYVLRKRAPFLVGVGRLSTWLEVHIFLCTLGPYLVLLHTSFRFGGIAAVSFWSMAVAVASGVFGRYLYARLPRAVGGQLQSLRAVEERRREAVTALEAAGVALGGAVFAGNETAGSAVPSHGAGIALPIPAPGLAGALAAALRADLGRRGRLRRLRRELSERIPAGAARDELFALARERDRIEQQIALILPFQRMFRYWHILHVPIALVMFAALAVHVAVAFLFGYGWPF